MHGHAGTPRTGPNASGSRLSSCREERKAEKNTRPLLVQYNTDWMSRVRPGVPRRKEEMDPFGTVRRTTATVERSMTPRPFTDFYHTHEIVPYLFLGGIGSAEDHELLRALGISHVLNVADDAAYKRAPPEGGDLVFMKLGVDDEAWVDITGILEECFAFIHKARAEKKGVLVHCMMGMSRSAAVVLSYLMKYENMRLLDAYWHTHDRRKVIAPNSGFAKQLIEFEKRLYGSATLEMHRGFWPVERKTAAQILKEREEEEEKKALPILKYRIREGCAERDAEGILSIYAHYVEKTVISFELAPPTLAAMRERLSSASGLLVAEVEPDAAAIGEGASGDRKASSDIILGFAYFCPFRDRPAYGHVCENSVYVHRDVHRRGIGRALLSALLESARKAGKEEMVAAIADPEGEAQASVALHRALGFAPVGTFRGVGHKFGRKIDVAFLQKALGGAEDGR